MYETVMLASPVIPESAISTSNISAPAILNANTTKYVTHSAPVLRSRLPDY